MNIGVDKWRDENLGVIEASENGVLLVEKRKLIAVEMMRKWEKNAIKEKTIFR